MKIHPWNEPQWQSLVRSHHDLPQAMLFSGLLGLGKNTLALALSMALLCQKSEQGQACQCCRSCHLFLAGTHPDFHVLSAGEKASLPELTQGYRKRYEQDETKSAKVKMQIPVLRIHQLTDALFSSAHTSECKVAIISPAERMNLFAANALLKFLEEPVGPTYLLLVSHQPEQLPATIRSRCTPIPFRAPCIAQVMNWLQQQLPGLSQEVLKSLFVRAGQSPLTAVALAGQQQQATECAEDISRLCKQQITAAEISEKWQRKKSVIENLQHLQRLLAQAIRNGSTGQVNSGNPQLPMKLTSMFEGYDRTSRAIRDGQSGLDVRLLIEDILLTLTA
ncbi:MAG TPA: hypothetical protein ENI62_13555 [Gammaproteobacteria bacterium]|nr:hypothetical protein [Gammaproteobacteria bacterium]